MSIIHRPSPNFDSRDDHTIDMLVLHYTGMKTAEEALERLCDTQSKVSAHYVVEEDGTVSKLVAEEKRAWHAGVSFWRGHKNINQRSIGIEIVNAGHEFGYVDFPEAQMEMVAQLCQGILLRHPIAARNVVAHSDIAPARKMDPGEKFNWRFLAQENVGLWPIPSFTAVDDAAQALSDYGYDITDLPAAIIAFQRHFRQNDVSGQWDSECGFLLQSLLDAPR